MLLMKDRTDPEMLPVLDFLKSVGFDVDLSDIDASRVQLGGVFEAMAEGAPPIEGVDITVEEAPHADGSFNVPMRIYRAIGNTETLPVIYWIHGGGYVLNSAEGDDAYAANLVLALDCVVVSVDYRLAPEHPFPAPMEDCYTGLKWMYDSAEKLGIDTSRIVIAGQSAGGGLAAGLAQMARDRNEVPVIHQFLYYPMIDDRNINRIENAEHDHYIWSSHSNYYGWKAYLGMEPGTDATPQYAAPLRTEDLAGLPPAYILTGDIDLFMAEDLAYATRLIQAGVPTEVHVYPGGVHAFDILGATTALAQRCNADLFSAYKRVLHGG